MATRLRRMKAYHPRKRASSLQKQALHDLGHKISGDVGAIILFFEEGNTEQLPNAQLKAKSDFLKYGPEMQKIAQAMGNRYMNIVRNYLNSVDVIIHSDATLIDKAKLHQCYLMREKLEKELTAA